MEPFTSITSVAAPLLRINIDTDAIIPSREMKRVSKEGLADGLFAAWRYLNTSSREPNPDFILNQPPYDQAKILLAGRNFGCGSSREHAVWAIKEWGVRAIIAPSFGSIFQLNCVRNGILPVIADAKSIDKIAELVISDPLTNRITVDLQNRLVRTPTFELTFDIAERERQMLLEGLDMIALTLKAESDIEAFEQADRTNRSWAYL